MPERLMPAPVATGAHEPGGDAAPPEVVDFIRFCHRRRAAAWPELYDVMCSVAARREFRGWGTDQLADRGVSLTLTGMPRLAQWVRATLGASTEEAALAAPGHPIQHAREAIPTAS